MCDDSSSTPMKSLLKCIMQAGEVFDRFNTGRILESRPFPGYSAANICCQIEKRLNAVHDTASAIVWVDGYRAHAIRGTPEVQQRNYALELADQISELIIEAQTAGREIDPVKIMLIKTYELKRLSCEMVFGKFDDDQMLELCGAFIQEARIQCERFRKLNHSDVDKAIFEAYEARKLRRAEAGCVGTFIRVCDHAETGVVP